MSVTEENHNNGSTEEHHNNVTALRVFDLYVDQLEGDVHDMDDALLVRLRWFGEDIESAIKRLTDDPRTAYEVVKRLSSTVRDLDARAGASDASHETLRSARSWAILLPVTAVHE